MCNAEKKKERRWESNERAWEGVVKGLMWSNRSFKYSTVPFWAMGSALQISVKKKIRRRRREKREENGNAIVREGEDESETVRVRASSETRFLVWKGRTIYVLGWVYVCV